MNDELKSLIEDAAKLLHANKVGFNILHFNPLDPERGDLWKVADAAGLVVGRGLVTNAWSSSYTVANEYISGDYQSQAIAVLRAASTVLHSKELVREEE